jgi:hypothetical protein
MFLDMLLVFAHGLRLKYLPMSEIPLPPLPPCPPGSKLMVVKPPEVRLGDVVLDHTYLVANEEWRSARLGKGCCWEVDHISDKDIKATKSIGTICMLDNQVWLMISRKLEKVVTRWNDKCLRCGKNVLMLFSSVEHEGNCEV